MTFSGAVTLSGSGQGSSNNGVIDFSLGTNSNIAFTGLISGRAGINLRQGYGGGGLTLSNSQNAYTGPTSITMGTLIAGGNAYTSKSVFGNAGSRDHDRRRQLGRQSGGPGDQRRVHDRPSDHGQCHGGPHDAGDDRRGHFDLFRCDRGQQQQRGAQRGVRQFGVVHGQYQRQRRHYRELSGQRQCGPDGHEQLYRAHDRRQRPVDLGLQRFGASAGTVGGIVPPASAVALSGGTLAFIGNASGAVNETFVLTGVAGFGSTVVVNGSGSGVKINLGPISRSGGVLDLPASSGVFTTSSSNTNGILGGYLSVNGYTDWASVSSGGTIVGLSANGGYNTNDFSNPGNNVDVTGAVSPPAGPATVNSLRFNSGSANLSLNGLLTLASGGIFVTPSGGSSGISGGA